ncbi:MAG: DMT family transporter [Anaerolineales bacterium]|nr:MAG: DMT family transporter [Anaerolineales bacterium]
MLQLLGGLVYKRACSREVESDVKTESRDKLLAYLTLSIGLIAIGFSAIFVRQAGVPGTVASFYRMAIPTTILAAPAIKRLRERKRSGPPLRWAVLGGFVFALDLSFWASGVVISGATIPTLLANTAPVWVGLGALLFFREELPRKFWFGLAIALLGTALVLGLESLRSMSLDLGALLGLLAGIFYAAYFLITQLGRKSLDVLSYFWVSGVSATVALFIFNLLLSQPMWGFTSKTYFNLLALGLISQGVGLLAITYVQGLLPATIVSATLLGQPVVTALLAGPLLGEKLQPAQIVGGAAVLLGVYVVHRSRAGDR